MSSLQVLLRKGAVRSLTVLRPSSAADIWPLFPDFHAALSIMTELLYLDVL